MVGDAFSFYAIKILFWKKDDAQRESRIFLFSVTHINFSILHYLASGPHHGLYEPVEKVLSEFCPLVNDISFKEEKAYIW